MAGRPFGASRRYQPATRKTVWAEFCSDGALQRAYNIKPEELEALSRAAMLGSFASKQDLIFMLNVIRRAGRR
jgi:hypothetical protein